MGLFAPGVAQGVVSGMDAAQVTQMRQAEMARLKQQQDIANFTLEESRRQQIRDQQMRTNMGIGMSPPTIAPGGQPGQSSLAPPQGQQPQAQQPPMQFPPSGAGMQGMSPVQPQPMSPPMQGQQPQIPRYQTVAGQPPQSPTAAQGLSPPVQTQQPSPDPIALASQGMLQEFIGRLQKANVPPDQLYDAVTRYMPIVTEQDKTQLSVMKAQLDASKAAEKAYTDVINLYQKGKNIDSQVNDRTGKLAQGEQRIVIQQQNADTNERRETDQYNLGIAKIRAAKEKAQAGLAPKPTELDDEEVARVWYDIFKNTNKAPPFAFGQAGNSARNKWTQIVAKFSKEDGGGSGVAQSQSDYKASTQANTAITKREAGIQYSIEKIKNDIVTMNSVLDRVATQGGASIINKPLNVLRSSLSDADYGVLDLVTKQVATEYERQLNGGQLSTAQLHVGASEDAKKLLNGSMTIAEIRAKLPIMMKEMANATTAAESVRAGLSVKNKSASDAEETKTIGGVTYHKINGQWMQ